MNYIIDIINSVLVLIGICVILHCLVWAAVSGYYHAKRNAEKAKREAMKEALKYGIDQLSKDLPSILAKVEAEQRARVEMERAAAKNPSRKGAKK